MPSSPHLLALPQCNISIESESGLSTVSCVNITLHRVFIQVQPRTLHEHFLVFTEQSTHQLVPFNSVLNGYVTVQRMNSSTVVSPSVLVDFYSFDVQADQLNGNDLFELKLKFNGVYDHFIQTPMIQPASNFSQYSQQQFNGANWYNNTLQYFDNDNGFNTTSSTRHMKIAGNGVVNVLASYRCPITGCVIPVPPKVY